MTHQQLRVTISCNAPYGRGGLGQHLAQVVESAIDTQHVCQYYCTKSIANSSNGHTINIVLPELLKYTPFRYSPGWINFTEIDCFDRAVAKQINPAQIFEGFVGQSLSTFKRARKLGYETLRLQAANSHVNNVVSQHQKAIKQYGIESSWLNEAQRRKTLKEYEMADVIYVASEYSRQTMISQGIPDYKLQRIELKVNPRYQPPVKREKDDKFHIVYVGSLTVMKGIPLLLEAFSRLTNPKAELILVGGWATRGMRRYLQKWMAKDARIRVVPGDPLPHLHRADVCIHPTYEDGFAYAPMEAMKCGIPVIVTEDTGMKEYVKEGINGHVIPTGNWEAILANLQMRQRKVLTGGVM